MSQLHLLTDSILYRWPAPNRAGRGKKTKNKLKEKHMLYTIAVVLIILWLLGLVTSYTLGGFIHILLVIAIFMILVNLISGRRPVV
jgi:fatty acid desaturase